MLSNLDFTIQKYRELCQVITESKYVNCTLREYLTPNSLKTAQSSIILRHDIDRTPTRALDVARVEHEFGLKGTYYFRAQKNIFVTKIIDQIAYLGHEIGYHYETMDKSQGKLDLAVNIFERELVSFREKYEITTVCAHGNPLTKYDNKDIWKVITLSNYGLLGEAFLSLDFAKFAYFSDSGRTWQNNEAQKMPGKDSVTSAFDQVKMKRTDDLIRVVGEGAIPNICILTHPERWTKNMVSFTTRYFLDLAFSYGKIVIYLSNKLSDRLGEGSTN